MVIDKIDNAGKSLAGDFEGQARQLFKSLDAILQKAGARLGDMVQMTVFVTCGRVEDGRGGLSPRAIAPFPISAHRTGLADFRLPALRLGSSQVIRQWVPRRRVTGQRTQMHASEAQDAVGAEDFRCRKAACATRLHLVPAAEEVAHRIVDMIVHGAVRHQARPVAEVCRPAAQHRVEPVADPRLPPAFARGGRLLVLRFVITVTYFFVKNQAAMRLNFALILVSRSWRSRRVKVHSNGF